MLTLVHLFSGLLIACSTLVVQSTNPVYSVLYLILAFFNASALVLLCGHDYMAVLFVVLYVGAMCTFFLFAIMILDIKVELSKRHLTQAPVNVIIGTLFGLICHNLLNDSQSALVQVNNLPLTGTLLDPTTQIHSLGAVLYTVYGWHLILASLILLSAMLGTIVLTLNQSASLDVKKQLIYEQNLRDFRLTVAKHDLPSLENQENNFF
jgi:NADH-quinone oxidoreductase subunit J